MTTKCPKCKTGLLAYVGEYPAIRCLNCGQLSYLFTPLVRTPGVGNTDHTPWHRNPRDPRLPGQ